MTQEHPITPPPELVQEWINEEQGVFAEHIATQAARWGADRQLELCERYWMTHGISPEGVVAMRYALRPLPLSSKEQALADLDLLQTDATNHGLGFDASAIRRALESLPD